MWLCVPFSISLSSPSTRAGVPPNPNPYRKPLLLKRAYGISKQPKTLSPMMEFPDLQTDLNFYADAKLTGTDGESHCSLAMLAGDESRRRAGFVPPSFYSCSTLLSPSLKICRTHSIMETAIWRR
ncbi:unnamed protein product [Linum trigynum]|uniref:Uncharacterized protein n=1 Tax=Linum trigynum TaxID=586398 RepID=A0AAV2FVN9_9ROSI